jgi:hypothetical protein
MRKTERIKRRDCGYTTFLYQSETRVNSKAAQSEGLHGMGSGQRAGRRRCSIENNQVRAGFK